MTKTLKLSKNAWGYLVSQYRAVLGRCQVLNLFGTLTVSSLLVLGCAGMAQAQQVDWENDSGVEIVAEGQEVSLTKWPGNAERPIGGGYGNTSMKTLNITSGSLTLRDQNRLINWYRASSDDGLHVTMTGGKLNIENNQAGDPKDNDDGWNGAKIAADTVTISGGEVHIVAAASDPNTYPILDASSSSLFGYHGLTLDGGTVTLEGNAQLGGGFDGGLKLRSGKVNMGNNTHLSFSDGSALNEIGENATINVAGTEAFIKIGQGIQSAGKINVNDGAELTFGDETPSTGSFNQTGGSISTAGVIKLEDNVTANIGDGATLSVSGNGYVDTASGTTLNFADNSILEVSAQTAQDSQGVIRGQGEVTTTANAKIRITNAKAGENYKILGNDIIKSSLNPSAWTGDNFLTDSTMLGLEWDSNENLFRTIVAASTSSALPGVSKSVGALVIGMYQDGLNDPQAQELGVRLLTRATNTSYMTDPKAAAIAVESTANMINWTPVVTQNAHQLGLSAVADRLSGLARNSFSPSAGDEAGGSFGVWAMPLYQHWNTKGVETNSFTMDTEGDLGGLALGADYTFNDSVRAGLSLNIGGGSAESYGQFNRTDDDFNFWGLGAYAGLRQNRFGLTADLTYTAVDNDLGQSLPAALAMDGLKSEVDSWAFSAGLRGDYEFNTEAVDITPHLGVRFTRLETKGYDVKSGGGVVLKGDSINQNVWTFPVGVAFSKNIQTEGGWTIKPALDLSIIPAAGDIDAKGDIRFTGISGAAELKTQIMDRVTYMGELGLNAGRDNMSLGLNYSLQAGEDSTAHGLYATFRYEFD